MDDDLKVQSRLRELVAEEVRALLGRRRLNGAKLAQAIDRSEMYVSRRLRGETAFDLDDLEKIADVLSVPVAQLLPSADQKGGNITRWSAPPIVQAERLSPSVTPDRPVDTRPAGRPDHPTSQRTVAHADRAARAGSRPTGRAGNTPRRVSRLAA
jgi:transcriptional regulator with XRE-family HTH domain